MLPLFLLLIPLTALANVFLMSNYPLRGTNLEKVINKDNYREMVEILKNIEDIKEVYVMEEEDKVYLYIERYPIIKKVEIRGNVAIAKEDVLSYLGIYEGMPVKKEGLKEEELSERIKRLYMDRGFLDAQAAITLYMDEEGYIYLYVGVDEGPVYFTEGGVYKGSTYPPERLDRVVGITKGRVVNEGNLRDGIFKLQDFYIKEGFLDSFVYYEGLQKIRLNKPYMKVLLPMDPLAKKSPLRILGSISEGISNLFRHPLAIFGSLIGRGHVAKPLFQIVEGARYNIEFHGQSFFDAKTLREVSGLERKGIDSFSLDEARESLLLAYKRKGFFDAEINYTFEGNRVDFYIKEGERYKTIGEGFDGKPYDEETIEGVLALRLEALKREGYTLADGRLKKEVLRDKKEVKVSFEIEKGKKQILKDIIYEGEEKELKKIFRKHREKLPAIFNTELIEALNLDIRQYFLKKGFMEGDFDIKVDIKEEGDTTYYTYLYTIREGPSYKLGETIYYGYKKTRQRELSYITEYGTKYSEELNNKTLYSLLNSGIFSGVNIKTFMDRDKKLVHRLIEVSEDKRGLLDFSLGYNTEEKLSLETFFGAKNLLGVGISAGARYRKTGKRELYSLELSDNFLFSRRLWFKSSIFKTYEEHKSYNLDSHAITGQVGYRITANTSIGPAFSLLENKVEGTTYNIKKYGFFLLREYKDDIFLPKRVHYDNLSLSFASGDVRYWKSELSTFYLIPLRRNYKLSFKVAGGAVSKSAPVFERFFLGGLRDLRGYSFEDIGYPKGGRYYIFGRLEFIAPLKEPFIGVVFTDIGNTAERYKDMFKSMKKDVGLAVGVDTPIGPIRLDVAFPMEKEVHTRFKIYLSVGYYY